MVSFASVDTNNMELTPMKVSFQGPGQSTAIDLGGTLGNVVIAMAYKKADIMADQFGKTVLDRRVSGIDIKVTTELVEIQNKDIWKVVFPHATKIPHTATGATISAASPAVVTLASHGFQIGQKVKFTAGTLPTGLTLGTTYYIIASGFTSGAFEVALTAGGAAINTSGSPGSGVTIEATGSAGVAIQWNSAIGDGDQINAGQLTLHPLSKAVGDVDTDWTFFKACSTAESEISYGPEGQAKLKCVWTILPDLSVTPARFFRYGDTTLV